MKTPLRRRSARVMDVLDECLVFSRKGGPDKDEIFDFDLDPSILLEEPGDPFQADGPVFDEEMTGYLGQNSW